MAILMYKSLELAWAFALSSSTGLSSNTPLVIYTLTWLFAWFLIWSAVEIIAPTVWADHAGREE